MTQVKKIFSGARWAASNTIVTTLVTLAQIPILTRYLEPTDFGIYASIVAITTLASSLAVSAFPDYLIIAEDETGKVRSTLYWLCALVSTSLFLVLLLSAPLLSNWLHEGETTTLFRIASLQVILAGFSESLSATLRKNLHFRDVTRASLTATVSSFVFALIILSFYQDTRVLVYSYIVGSLLSAGLIIIAAEKRNLLPQTTFDYTALEPFFKLGRWRLATYLLNIVNTRFDVVLITWILGPIASGYYFVAWRIMMQPLTKIMPIITQIALPAFSTMKHDRQKMQTGYRRASQLTAFILAPTIFGILILYPLINNTLLGPGWETVSQLVQILSILVLVRIFTPLTGAIMLALQDFKWSFRWQITTFAFTTPSVLLVGLFFPSTEAIALTVSLVQGAILLTMYFTFLNRLEVPNITDNLIDVLAPLTVSAVMGTALWFFKSHLSDALTNPYLAALLVAVGAGIYMILATLFLRRHASVLHSVLTR